MRVQFIEVAQVGDEFERMQKFATSFDHKICPMRNGRLVALLRKGNLFGYASIVYTPLVFPAFHPTHSSPRAVAETLATFRANAQLTGGDGFVAAPSDRTTFPSTMLEKAGFQKIGAELFCIKQ